MRHARGPANKRFEAKVERVTETGCWLWTGTVDRKGYGRFNDEHGQKRLAHRWSFVRAYGVIPSDMVLDHLCNTPSCANPEHLAVVTSGANTLRSAHTIAARNRAKGTCPKGHDYRTILDERGRVRRRCPVCQRVAVRDCMRRKRAG